MQVNYRRKGSTLDAQIAPDGLPEVLRGTGEFGGVDLTAYTVISTSGRRADQAHRDIPKAIIVFVDVHNVNGGGVILPDNFNPARLRFFKTADQKKEEEAEKIKVSFQALAEEIERSISGVNARVNARGNGVNVTPDGELFSRESSWPVRPTTVEEAVSLVAAKLPYWEEWRERSLAAIAAGGFALPGRGSVKIDIRWEGGASLSFYDSGSKKSRTISMWRDENGEWKFSFPEP